MGFAELLRPLKGYTEHDTQSAVEGRLEVGRYRILERFDDVPGEATYLRLAVWDLGGHDTWICSRWRATVYAREVEAPEKLERPAYDDEPLAIEEDRLLAELPAFAPFRYDLDDAYYPSPLPGVRVAVRAPTADPPPTNNCCTFAEGLLVTAWSKAHPGRFTWSRERHAQMMILSSDDLFSPVTAAVESGMAHFVDDASRPPAPWTLLQGWRRGYRNGHTFLMVDHHPETDRVLTLESNASYGLDGVGFRGLGNLRDHDLRPPPAWWERPSLWTWSDMRSRYRHLAQAALKVKARSWSGLDA